MFSVLHQGLYLMAVQSQPNANKEVYCHFVPFTGHAGYDKIQKSFEHKNWKSLNILLWYLEGATITRISNN